MHTARCPRSNPKRHPATLDSPQYWHLLGRSQQPMSRTNPSTIERHSPPCRTPHIRLRQSFPQDSCRDKPPSRTWGYSHSPLHSSHMNNHHSQNSSPDSARSYHPRDTASHSTRHALRLPTPLPWATGTHSHSSHTSLRHCFQSGTRPRSPSNTGSAPPFRSLRLPTLQRHTNSPSAQGGSKPFQLLPLNPCTRCLQPRPAQYPTEP